MSCSSPSVEARHESATWKVTPGGVRYQVARMSFGRRLELMRAVRDLARRLEFSAAGDSVAERAEAAILGAEIDHLYLRHGLLAVEGLSIDGAAATPETLAQRGPEELTREIVAEIKAEWHLSEDERKNS